MKKRELSDLIAHVITETLLEFVSTRSQKLYKPKRRHIEKYRKSKLHPDEMAKQARIKAIQQVKGREDDFNEPAYMMAPNVRVFLNTTLEAIPKTEASTKILYGAPVSKPEAMGVARAMMALPGFPFQQPRKLMNLLVLLSMENNKH